MPARSSGCATCRARKIRCDEARPGCKRCATHGVSCPGYRDPAPGEIAFEDQTNATALRVQEQHRSRKTGNKGTTTFVNSGVEDVRRKGQSSTTALTKARRPAMRQHEVEAMNQLESRYFDASIAGYYPPQSFNHPTISFDLASPALGKMQMYNTFLNSYLPKHSTRDHKQIEHFHFLVLMTQEPPKRPELAAGLDALTMVVVGNAFQDERLKRLAVQSYGRSLTLLSQALTKPEASGLLYDDEILATTNILTTCEFFDAIKSLHSGWSRHVEGSEQLLRMRGPQSVNSRLALMLVSNLEHMALSNSLIYRRPSILAKPEWRAVLFRAQNFDTRTLFYDSALQIPDILEKSDKLSEDDPDALEKVKDLLDYARRIEGEIRKFHTKMRARAELAGFTFNLEDIEKFPTFASLCTDRTIDKGFRFPSVAFAYLFSVNWNCMHYLRSEIQKLHVFRHKLEPEWFPDNDEIVSEDELMGYTMNLCHCMPFFVEPTTAAMGSIGMFLPLRTASLYFVRRGLWKYARWMAMVRDNCFQRGLSPPSVKQAVSVLPILNLVSSKFQTPGFVHSPSGFSQTSSPGAGAGAGSPDSSSASESTSPPIS